jgi:hypothetical protein
VVALDRFVDLQPRHWKRRPGIALKSKGRKISIAANSASATRMKNLTLSQRPSGKGRDRDHRERQDHRSPQKLPELQWATLFSLSYGRLSGSLADLLDALFHMEDAKTSESRGSATRPLPPSLALRDEDVELVKSASGP